MRIISLVTDAFGGRGGIALYNRDLLTALCNNKECNEVVAVKTSINTNQLFDEERKWYVTPQYSKIYYKSSTQ